MNKKRKCTIGLLRGATLLCTALTAALVLSLVGYVMVKGIPHISWELLSIDHSSFRYFRDIPGKEAELKELQDEYKKE